MFSCVLMGFSGFGQLSVGLDWTGFSGSSKVSAGLERFKWVLTCLSRSWLEWIWVLLGLDRFLVSVDWTGSRWSGLIYMGLERFHGVCQSRFQWVWRDFIGFRYVSVVLDGFQWLSVRDKGDWVFLSLNNKTKTDTENVWVSMARLSKRSQCWGLIKILVDHCLINKLVLNEFV